MSDDMYRWRLNVAAVIMDSAGNLLLARKSPESKHLHFPQGGVHDGETYRHAMEREVEEEVGLPPSSYEIVARWGGCAIFTGRRTEKVMSGMDSSRLGFFFAAIQRNPKQIVPIAPSLMR